MGHENQASVYQLAGRSIFFDRPIAELQPYAIRETRFPAKMQAVRRSSETNRAVTKSLAPLIQATGWIGDGFSTVSVWRDVDGFILEIPNAGDYWIATDGKEVNQVWLDSQAEQAFLSEALLGPPLVLALALQGVWCLHACAALYKMNLIAFLGESGAGKSTLATFIDSQPGFSRLVDDILPITWEAQTVQACPHFPQLKLPAYQQPVVNSPEYVPVAAMYLLSEQPGISIQSLRPSQAILALVQQTVAARLFDRELLEYHLVFCSQAATQIPIRRLAYPHQYDILPLVWEALQADLIEMSA